MAACGIGQSGAMLRQQSAGPAARMPGKQAKAGAAVQRRTVASITSAPFLPHAMTENSVI